jgi:hypothetical protein
MSCQCGIEFDSDNMGGACSKGSGDGAGSGADFDYGASRQVAKRRSNALNGLRIVEEVLSEPGFEGIGCFDGR